MKALQRDYKLYKLGLSYDKSLKTAFEIVDDIIEDLSVAEIVPNNELWSYLKHPSGKILGQYEDKGGRPTIQLYHKYMKKYGYKNRKTGVDFNDIIDLVRINIDDIIPDLEFVFIDSNTHIYIKKKSWKQKRYSLIAIIATLLSTIFYIYLQNFTLVIVGIILMSINLIIYYHLK